MREAVSLQQRPDGGYAEAGARTRQSHRGCRHPGEQVFVVAQNGHSSTVTPQATAEQQILSLDGEDELAGVLTPEKGEQRVGEVADAATPDVLVRAKLTAAEPLPQLLNA